MSIAYDVIRLPQVVLIVTFVGFSWLAMQAAHECGHVLISHATGGKVIRAAIHPLIISRTDICSNPHPLAVVWGGPGLGCAIPLLAFGIAALCRAPGVYLFRFFAGFCLVANGIYIGAGSFLANGADPKVMTDSGSPRWVLCGFGIIALLLGLFLWHRQGPYFGLGAAKGKVSPGAAIVSAALFLGLVAAELLRDVR
jgi:hypothetical protein